MSLKNWFNKPKWKSKDANIRAIAVSSDNSPELLSMLASISQNDESANVRSAALKRLDDYQLIAKIAENDKDDDVKNAAVKILQDWFINQDDIQQKELIKTLSNSRIIETVAAGAKNSDVREICINKISKQGLLGDLLINEKNSQLRQLILSKIDKPATLKRILKSAKNKDKAIVKAIREKLENDGDVAKMVEQKALDLCEQMEKFIHNRNLYGKSDVDAVFSQWQELAYSHDLSTFAQRFEGAHRTASLTFDPQQRDEFLNQQRQQRINSKIAELQAAITDSQNSTWEQLQNQISKYSGFDLSFADDIQKTEYDNLLEQLTTLRDKQSQKQDLPAGLINVADKLDAALKQKYNQPRQISQFRKMWDENAKSAKNNTAFNTLKAKFDNSMLMLADKIEKSANLRDEAAQNAVAAIEKARQQIKDGHLSDAKIIMNKIAANKKIAGNHPLIRENKFDFDTLWNELKELRQWQRWSNDKVRVRLIEELQQLVGTGTHPDALLKKMKEANAQWKDMEDHEKLEGDRYNVRNQELYGQFREVQKALFEPAQTFFEKRSEIWSKELEALEQKIQTLHEINLQETEDRDLARLVRDALKQLRNLDKIPPKNRGKCAARIRAGVARIDAHLQESYKIATRRKEKLIEMAIDLIEMEDLSSAIEQAKVLQQEWKTAGIVQQSQERKLWKKFRKANDAVFNRLQEQRDIVKQENQAQFNQANELVASFEKSVKSEKSAQAINSLIEKFKDEWNALKVDNRNLQNKAKKIIENGEQKANSMVHSENFKQLKAVEKFADICQKLENKQIDAESAQQAWDKLSSLDDNKLMKKLQNRLSNADSENPDYTEHANNLLIASEYLIGIASPDEHKEKRLAYQVEELSKHMSGEENLDPIQKASNLLADWFTLGGTDAKFQKSNEKRIKKVLKGLFDLVKG
ncbi:MAG TPA: DUF349 domain-containing protein [Gammaproteobacteria bacterium]|nr:DUF349 domain-containing protein [Xanthomonadales bacterium]MCB1593512.1 DUF349 domain-containing protein [Xanthomonadales bacterium]HOP21724.1 DUF349 domain-containing protein [Gammaproteobacteria bacterium]HPI95268.1 DUF349 domain-containing protein [Gammaproteobacteria bacterium]HPQ86657.1 DUF349 domain-containing protein [Gammaproteobacteria bacterium]